MDMSTLGDSVRNFFDSKSPFDELSDNLVKEIDKKHQETIKALSGNLDAAVDYLIVQHTKDMQQIITKLDMLQTAIHKLEVRITKIEKLPITVQSDVKKEIPLEVRKVEFKPMIKFAVAPDCYDPVSFRDETLHEEQHGTFFKLTIKSETTAIYELVDDSEIHLEALAAFDPIITSTSVYANMPYAPQKIVVTKPGMLMLNNGMWQILEKQQITIE